MDIATLTTWIRARYQQLKTARDDGVTSLEMAVIVAALLVVAALLLAAIRSKVSEKIGIINGA